MQFLFSLSSFEMYFSASGLLESSPNTFGKKSEIKNPWLLHIYKEPFAGPFLLEMIFSFGEEFLI
jgi:hypothetical protein